MKRLIYVTILTLLCASPALIAQSTGTLNGVIISQDDGLPLIATNVTVEQNGQIVSGTASDIDGKFSFILSPGKYDLVCSYIGYKTSKKTVFINAGTVTVENIEMIEQAMELQTLSTTDNYYSRDMCCLRTVAGVMTCNSMSTVPKKVKKQKKQSTISGTKKITKSDIRDHTSLNDGNYSEEYAVIIENDFLETKKHAKSTFSIDVDKAAYSNIRRFINNGSMPPANAIRLEEMINYFDYNYPQPKNEHPFSINLETSDCPWNSAHQLVLIGLQGKEMEKEEAPASNLVFLIDVSGSMGVPNKLPLVKSSLEILINNLNERDKISIVVYAGAAGLVLSPTAGSDKSIILNAINNLSSGGSTAGGEGILLAYKMAQENYINDGNNRVILCTDGDFNVGPSSETELENLIVSKRDDGIYLSVLGFGMGNYKDNTMELLADKGNGNYFYIDSEAEANKVFKQELMGTLFTIAKDVKVQVVFNDKAVKSYRLIGYENRLLEDWEFDDDSRDAGEIGAGHEVTALYEIELMEDAGEEAALVDFKFRYKPIDKKKSILGLKTLRNTRNSFENASENLRFASTVAAYGMILRNSAYKGSATLDWVAENAKKSKNHDPNGYREEFISLVEATKSLQITSK